MKYRIEMTFEFEIIFEMDCSALTFREPVGLGFLVVLQQWCALLYLIGCLIGNTVFEALTQNAEDFIVNQFVAFELHIGLPLAAWIIHVALIDGRHTVELLMIPWIVLLIWDNNRFYPRIQSKSVVR